MNLSSTSLQTEGFLVFALSWYRGHMDSNTAAGRIEA